MKKLVLFVSLVALVSLAGCENKEQHTISLKGPSGETTSMTIK